MTTTTNTHNRFRHDAMPQEGTVIMMDRYDMKTGQTKRVRATIVEIAAAGSLHCESVLSVEADGEIFAVRASDCYV